MTANANTGANFNRYWYANNNPYRFTDPDGRLAFDDEKREEPPPPPSPEPKKDKPEPTTLGTITVTGTRPAPASKPISIPWGKIGGTLVRGGSIPLVFITGMWPYDMGYAACEMPGGPPCGANIVYSKGGKQNVRDTGLIGVSDEEISRRLKDPSTSGKEKRRLQKEQKSRGSRNKSKRDEQS